VKKWIFPVILVGVLILGSVWLVGVKNELERLNDAVNAQWKEVELSFQKRALFIPNLVTAASEYAEFNNETLTLVNITQHTASEISLNPLVMTSDDLNLFQQTQSELSEAMSKMLITFDRYPYLKTYDAFKDPLATLQQKEDSIYLQRSLFNETVGRYNIELEEFPNTIIVALRSLSKRAYFEAETDNK